MSFASKYNTQPTSTLFTYKQIPDAPFAKLKDLYADGYRENGKTFIIRGAFINEKSRYGASAAFMCDGYNISLPQHMLDDVRDMLADQDAISAMNAGTAGGYVYSYKNRNGGDSYSVRFVDIKPAPAEDLPF